MDHGMMTSLQMETVYPRIGRLAFTQSALYRTLLLVLLLIGLIPNTFAAQAQRQIVPLEPGIAIQPPKEIDKLPLSRPLTLTLTARPDHVAQGSYVHFGMAFSPDTPVRSINYKLWINGREVGNWWNENSYNYRFNEPGSFQAQVTATTIMEFRPTREVRSNEVRIVVIRPPDDHGPSPDGYRYQEPTAGIFPEFLSLPQGEEARFNARYSIARGLNIAETSWDGPAGVSGNPNIYIVPTHNLNPGDHAIHFRIRDSKGQVANAQAILRVLGVEYVEPRAHISPETLTLTQGEEAHFRASLGIDRRLEITETRWDGPTGVSHNPESYIVPTGNLEPGTYPIHYHVRDSRQQVAEAQAQLRVRVVEPPYVRPRAQIIPESLTLTQGAEARFLARHRTDPRLDIAETRWEGPAGMSRNPESYVVQTDNLKPGTYPIHYHISDTREQVAEAEASLHIEERSIPPISAAISPKTLRITQGEEAVFRATYQADPRLEVQSRWDGPAGHSDNLDTYLVPTHDLSPGTYTIHYQIRDSQDRSFEAESVLHIMSANGPVHRDDGLLFWLLGGSGALAAGAGLGWWLRQKWPKPKEENQKKPKSRPRKITVKVDPQYDSWRGGFEKTAEAAPQVQLTFIADLGDQDWSDIPDTAPDDRGVNHD